MNLIVNIEMVRKAIEYNKYEDMGFLSMLFIMLSLLDGTSLHLATQSMPYHCPFYW